MDAKDILRLALFVFFFAFALRSGFRIRVRSSVKINSTAETEDTEKRQIPQHLQDNSHKLNLEPNGYESKNSVKEMSETNSNVNVSSGAINMIVTLLMILI